MLATTDTAILSLVRARHQHEGVANLAGNVIAMQGFIDKYGKDFNGVRELDAKDVSAWGAEYTAGYIFILFFGTPINDYLGRRWSMLVLQLFMIISTVMSLVSHNPATWGAAKIFQVRIMLRTKMLLIQPGSVGWSRSGYRAILRV